VPLRAESARCIGRAAHLRINPGRKLCSVRSAMAAARPGRPCSLLVRGGGAGIASVHAAGSQRGGSYCGCPPPPLGFPGPTRGGCGAGLHERGAGLSCGPFSGPPGPGWQFGHGGGGSNGAALTSPTPNVSADMPTPVAIATAPATRFTYIFGSSRPRLRGSPRRLPATQAARRRRNAKQRRHRLGLRIVTTPNCIGEAHLSRGIRAAKCADGASRMSLRPSRPAQLHRG